ncbi:MAG: uroporphyrinogen-III synthase [Betaproteobacteria bacterium]
MISDLYPLSVPPRDPGPLEGLGIVVTRPQRQAAVLAGKVASLGGVPIIWPAIVILPPPDVEPLTRAHAMLAGYDIAIYVSANAVEFGAPPRGTWPARVVAYAPGPGTAEALAAMGVPGACVPATSFDSEGLLELAALADVSGKRVVIFRGEGGREFLGNTLRARGAAVDHVPCYRRVAPTSGAGGLVEAMREGRAHALTMTSSEGLDNLVAAIGPGGRDVLARLPLFAAHPRIAERAREHGLRAVETAGGDAGLLAGVLEWFSGAARDTAPRRA